MDRFIQENQTRGGRGPIEYRITSRVEDLQTVWDALADRMRQTYQNLARNRQLPFSVQMRTFNGNSNARIYRNLVYLTGDMLFGFFDALLVSDETIDIMDVVIEFAVLGVEMNDSQLLLGGRGQLYGTKFIPERLKNKGLTCHPETGQFQEELLEEGCCGPRAVLFGMATELFSKLPLDILRIQSREIATSLKLVDGFMKIADFAEMLKLEGFTSYRIVVFRLYNRQADIFCGPDWGWEEGRSLETPDPKTVHVFYDAEDQHYYTMKAVVRGHFNRFKHGPYVPGPNQKSFFCYSCYAHFGRLELFQEHSCGKSVLCKLCKIAFAPDAWLDHEKLHYAFECSKCEKHFFHGKHCYDQHLENNCSAPNGEKEQCKDCIHWYKEEEKQFHRCTFQECTHCSARFATKKEQDEHRCFLDRKINCFWEPIQEKEKVTEIELHWFYDFETERMPIPNVPNQYELRVMAWAVQLIIPDELTRDFVEKNELIQHFNTLFSDQLRPRFGELHGYEMIYNPLGNSVLYYGTKIESFRMMAFQICKSSKKNIRMKPILWAHNGSKFDVKFVLDDLVDEGYEMFGKDYSEDNPTRKRHGKQFQTAGMGSKIIFLKADGVSFQCSLGHFAMELRKMPDMFGLSELVKKGEFPYGRLSSLHWDMVHEMGLPPLKEYEPDAKSAGRRMELILWWTTEQKKRNVPRQLIKEQLQEFEGMENVLEELETYDQDLEKSVQPWIFKQELYAYLFDDVNVGARCMEKYHQSSVAMHERINRPIALQDKVVSPLSCKTAPSWANNIYRAWFVPENTCARLRRPEATFIRESLRGGRTDKRANVVSLDENRYKAGDRIRYADFTSLYPSVQKTQIHDTFYPVGAPKWLKGIYFAEIDKYFISGSPWPGLEPHLGKVNNQIILDWAEKHTGFLRIEAKCVKYVTHPTLSRLGGSTEEDKSLKLLFENKDIKVTRLAKKEKDPEHPKVQTYAKKVGGVYGIPEIVEAIRCGEIEVTDVLEGIIFEKGTNVFNDYVDFFYELKDKAQREKNKGLRSLAKLLLNSLWGKLGQRSYPSKEWISDISRLDYVSKRLEEGVFQLKNLYYTAEKVWVEYFEHTDFNNLRETNIQLAAFVSMWGRITLHKKVLDEHGQRVLYCDTDSGIVYIRGGTDDNEKLEKYIGNGLGKLVDEIDGMVEGKGFTKPYIKQVVFVAPKTYALDIECFETKKHYFKVVCKGFEASFAGSKNLNFTSMHELVNDKFDINQRKMDDGTAAEKRQRIEGVERTQFVSGSRPDKAKPIERMILKNIEGNYTKGKVHPTDSRLIIPFGDFEPQGSFLKDLESNVFHHYE